MTLNQQDNAAWSRYRQLALKFFTIFFTVLTVPLDYKFYVYLFHGSWLDFHITELVRLVSYLPGFFNEVNQESHLGIDGFYSWWLAILVAAAGTFVWKPNESNYDRIYYWLRVVLRYKLALILIAYGAIKAYPLQFPFPSLSNLLTNYGDFLPWKIWAHTVGVAPNYEAFLGATEILAGILLLYRPTVTFGAALTIGVLTNVVYSSFSYQMGNQVLTTYVFLTAVFLFAHDLERLYVLFFKEQTTPPETFSPVFSARTVIITKGFTAVIASVIFLSALFNYEVDPYLTPKAKELENAFGFYNVKDFVLNNDTIPYTRTDTNRWQNVVFEKWATISVKTASPVKVDQKLYLTGKLTDIDRVYESAGVGDRRYYQYTIDSAASKLQLKNKNINYKGEQYTLNFSRPDDKTIILEGQNQKGDKLKATLERLDKKYILIESRRFPIQL